MNYEEAESIWMETSKYGSVLWLGEYESTVRQT